jgi:ATP-dependent DNA helicase RecQ
VEQTAEFLVAQGIAALPYHAGLDAETRAAQPAALPARGRHRDVATIAFGMGIDKPDVRSSRTWTCRSRSRATTRKPAAPAATAIRPMPGWPTGSATPCCLQRMIEDPNAAKSASAWSVASSTALIGYCESTACRRQSLLAYFGEAHAARAATATTASHRHAATTAPRRAEGLVVRLSHGQRFGAAHVIDVLRGAQTQKVFQFGHENVSTYGIGTELDAKQWRSVFRQLVAGGWLAVDVEGHGALRLTSASAGLLKGETTLTLRAETEKAPKRRESRNAEVVADLSDEAAQRFEALRSWRSAVAREQGVPAYVIFHDATLRQIALQEPGDLDALARVQGVGVAKLERYGRDVIETLATGAQ